MVPRHNGSHRPTFPDARVITQGGLVPPTLFNVVVDNVIRTWLAMIVEDQRVAHDVSVDTFVQCLGVLYADDGTVGSQDPNWL